MTELEFNERFDKRLDFHTSGCGCVVVLVLIVLGVGAYYKDEVKAGIRTGLDIKPCQCEGKRD